MAAKTAQKEQPKKLDPKLLKEILQKVEAVAQTRVVSIGKIHPDPKNARLHNERNIAGIKHSILKFGQVSPVVVDKKGMILKGHGVQAAMLELGLSKIQIKVVPFAGNLARAYALADNRTGELSSFDQQVMAGVMRDIMADEELIAFLEGEVPGFTGAEQANIISLLEADGELAFEGGGAADVELLEEGEEDAGDHVRMAQLFLDNKTFADFMKMTEALAEKLGTDNLTDTVFTVVKQSYQKLFPPKTPSKPVKR